MTREDLEHKLNGIWYDAGGFSKEEILDLAVAAYNKAIEDAVREIYTDTEFVIHQRLENLKIQ